MKKTIKLTIFLLLTFLIGACEGDTVYLPQPNKGKVNVYIEGSITNAEAQAKLDAEVGTITENIYVQNTTLVNAITIKPVNNIRDIKIENNTVLTSVILQGNGNKMNDFYIKKSTKITNIALSGIIEAKTILFDFATTISNTDANALESISVECHDLVTINGWLDLYIGWNLNQQAHTLNFYDLKQVNKLYYNNNYSRWQGNFNAFNMPKLEQLYNVQVQTKIDELTFPMLKKTNNLSFGWGAADIGLINLPLLEEINGLGTNVIGLSINFQSLLFCRTNMYIRGSLSSEKMNHFLHQLINLPNTTTSQIFNLNDSSNAPPTAQGLIDKQTLINKGYTVLTN